MKRKTHNALVLEVLADGAWHDHLELYALHVIVHSRVAELRKLGYTIERSTRRTEGGESRYRYRLTGVPPVDLTPRVRALEAQLEEPARARIEALRAGACAAVAQRVERDVANVEAAGSSPASRFDSTEVTPARLFAPPPVIDPERDYQAPPSSAEEGFGCRPELEASLELRAVEEELAAMEADGFDVQRYDELVGRRRELEDRLYGAAA